MTLNAQEHSRTDHTKWGVSQYQAAVSQLAAAYARGVYVLIAITMDFKKTWWTASRLTWLKIVAGAWNTRKSSMVS